MSTYNFLFCNQLKLFFLSPLDMRWDEQMWKLLHYILPFRIYHVVFSFASPPSRSSVRCETSYASESVKIKTMFQNYFSGVLKTFEDVVNLKRWLYKLCSLKLLRAFFFVRYIFGRFILPIHICGARQLNLAPLSHSLAWLNKFFEYGGSFSLLKTMESFRMFGEKFLTILFWIPWYQTRYY